MKSRRCIHEDLTAQSTTHVGLWLDKYLAQNESGDSTARVQLISASSELTRQVPAAATPDSADPAVRFFHSRWKPELAAYGAHVCRGKIEGRLAIGLGAASVWENAVRLHHTYGLPMLPGSSIKGLTAAFARQRVGDVWAAGGRAYEQLFGSTDAAGAVVFHDALYIPGSGSDQRALHPDIITPHQFEYYRGSAAPSPTESPIPVPFISVSGSFLFAFSGDAAWVHVAHKLLCTALQEWGIGAKTAAGYGRIHLDPLEMSAIGGAAAATETVSDTAQAFVQRIQALAIRDVASQLPTSFVEPRGRHATNAADRALIAQALLAKIEEAKRTKAVSDKPWFKILQEEAADT